MPLNTDQQNRLIKRFKKREKAKLREEKRKTGFDRKAFNKHMAEVQAKTQRIISGVETVRALPAFAEHLQLARVKQSIIEYFAPHTRKEKEDYDNSSSNSTDAR